MRAAPGLAQPARRLATQAVAQTDTVEVCETRSSIGRALVVAKGFRADETVYTFSAGVGTAKSRYSVQVGRDEHTEGENHMFIYINHSCQPSCRLELLSIDGKGVANRQVRVGIVADRDMSPGEPITFDYNTTEWAMAEPFTCNCETARPCNVGGASTMTAEESARWLQESNGKHAWAHIQELLLDARKL